MSLRIVSRRLAKVKNRRRLMPTLCVNQLRSLSSSAASTSSDATKPLDMVYGPVNAFQMNQYAIACTRSKEGVIIDCGATTKQEIDAFLAWFHQKNYKLTAVWQTHAHLDHIAGLGMLYDQIDIQDAPINLHKKERGIYNSFDQRCQDFGFVVEGGHDLPKDSELTYFDDDTTSLSLGELSFDIIHTPGHSPGHVGFLEPTSKSFFGGDFILQGSIGRTDFPTSSHDDMIQSLKHFVETMDEEVIIYPGHGQPTVLKEEKQYNPFLREIL